MEWRWLPDMIQTDQNLKSPDYVPDAISRWYLDDTEGVESFSLPAIVQRKDEKYYVVPADKHYSEFEPTPYDSLESAQAVAMVMYSANVWKNS
jgi:hypothetical protein